MTWNSPGWKATTDQYHAERQRIANAAQPPPKPTASPVATLVRHDAQGLGWRWKSVPVPRPLYNLDKLAARLDAAVVVCEGEKSADAASLIFPKSVATTSPGGANAAGKADWSKLRGRKVLIWPDDDAAGGTYAGKVGSTLAVLNCNVSIVDAAALARTAPDGGTREPAKDGWDAADAITEWADAATLRLAVLKSAKPFDAAKAVSAYISYGRFTMDADGLHAEVKRGRSDDSELGGVRVSASFEILGLGRNPDGKGWGRFLRWRDADGRQHEKFVSDEALQGDAPAICAPLAAEGLQIVRGQQRAFADYLSGAETPARVTTVQRTGWHEIEGESVFVLPTERFGRRCVPRGGASGPGDSQDRFGQVFLDAAAHGPYETKGTLADWRAGVAALATNHAIPMLAISAAFAGPLLHLAGLEGGGLNLFGQSSRGKTTCLQAAASVWGRGATPGYVRAWRATANGLEGAAAQSTDTVMVLDELGMVDPRDAAQSLYGLANGAGKARASRDGSLRDPKTWRVLYLSSGELPVETKLAETPGRKARAGQLVRLLDVPADRGAGFGVFDNGGPHGDPSALAQSINLAATSAYGTAGPEFVRRLIEDGVTGEDVRGLISEFVSATIPAGADGQVERAAKRFGLIFAAGELATTFGIVPWAAGAAREAAAWALARWIELRGGTEPAEARQAVETIRLFIEQHGEARFSPVDDADARPVANRAGYRRGDGAKREWWVLPEVWRHEICTGHDAQFVARVLAGAGMLRTQADGLQCNVRVGNATHRAYVVTASIFEGAADAG